MTDGASGDEGAERGGTDPPPDSDDGADDDHRATGSDDERAPDGDDVTNRPEDTDPTDPRDDDAVSGDTDDGVSGNADDAVSSDSADDAPGDGTDETARSNDRGDTGRSSAGPATAAEGGDGPTRGRSERDEPTVRGRTDPEPWTVEWLLTGDSAALMTVRDVISSVGTVAIIGLVLFAISGVWPPLVAVQSGSMEPHMHRGDLVYLVEEDRFPPEAGVEGTGVVTYRRGKEVGHWSFGNYGNVIVYRPDGGGGTPIIHRARLYVEEGENWVKRADDSYLGSADTCAEVYSCPAPHDGFITKGDANGQYDQAGLTPAGSQSTVVKPSWVVGRAKVKIPVLGYVRLWFASAASGGVGSVGDIGGVAVASLSGTLFRLRLAALALMGGLVAAVPDD